MKLFKRMKDGGPESTVTGYWLIEAKSLVSALVLKFDGKSREAFHNHAFNCISWVLRGKLTETMLDGTVREYKPSLVPFITRRSDFHKVDSDNKTYVLTFRGPWAKTWNEFTNELITLTSGRKIIG
jgi:hypothetical protein